MLATRHIPVFLVILLAVTAGCAKRYRVDRSPTPSIDRSGASHQSAATPAPPSFPGWPSGPEPPEVDSDGPEISIDEVEQAIRGFQERRNREGPEADAAWPILFEILDAYLAQPAARISLSPLIRARVAAEFELDQDRRRPGGADPQLEQVISEMIGRLDERVRAVHRLARGVSARERGGMTWPIASGVITSGYGTRRDPINRTVRFHAGLDLAGPENGPVYAAAAGRVEFAGWGGDSGRMVKIRHDEHTETAYCHLNLTMVELDQEVRAGDVIGLLGGTGRVTGAHLHFTLSVDGKPVDPIDRLQAVPLTFSDTPKGVVFGFGESEPAGE